MLKSRRFLSTLGICMIFVVVAVLGFGATCYAEENTLQEIMERGKLIIGEDCAVQPWAFRNPETGEIEGFIIDLARLYANRLGVELEIKDFEWAGLFPALFQKKVDLLAAHMTVTVLRSAQVTFTDPWLVLGSKALVRADSPLEHLEDINQEGVVITNTPASVYTQMAREDFPKATIKAFPKGSDCVQAVLHGRADVLLEDEPPLLIYMQNFPGKFKILPEYYTREFFAWAVRQGDWALRDSINIFLREIKLTGEYAELYKKWLGKEWEPTLLGY